MPSAGKRSDTSRIE